MKYAIQIVILISSCAFCAEDDLYDFTWLDPDKKVYVLQNKLYQKAGLHYTGLSYVNNQSTQYDDTYGTLFKYGYYFTELWGVEFNHITYTNMRNDNYRGLKYVSGTEPFNRRPLSSSIIYAIYSPFYGKINTFNKIVYFDWYFGVGTGNLTTESNIHTVTDSGASNTFKTETYNPVNLKTGLKVHINKRTHLSLEYINSNYQAETPKSKSSFRQNNDIAIGLEVSF